jgi:endonuclease/exonuclease/phosphatase family metal-dependent hydrolase
MRQRMALAVKLKRMRILSYNILDGGEGRADPLAEVIEANRPDVVALVEATNLQVIERIANRLKMDFVHAPGRESQASALLTRWTIRDSVNHGLLRAGLSKSFLKATVITPEGEQLVFGVLHLHHHPGESDEQQRERELDIILDLFKQHRDARTPHILLGDFNAHSPRQRIDVDKLKPATRQEWEANGRQLPRRAIQKLLDAGYVDTFSDGVEGTFTTQFPGQRVDYIFVHGIDPARVTDAWIEQDRLAKYASDHFPVGAAID